MIATSVFLTCLLAAAPDARPSSEAATGGDFAIEIVDRETGRGVPLVELATVNHVRYYTDSNGIAAIRDPELLGRKVFFSVKSHGYEFPKDGFGFRGQALEVVAGGGAKLEIDRLNIARRLYRVTGAGIYRDSLLVGRPAPLREPLLNGSVFGSDSVVNAVYRGRVHWFWGDTTRPQYPLGNFHVPGAVSLLPSQGGLDPAVGVNLEYFVDDQGFARPTARMPGDGPTWITGLVPLPDANGHEQLYAAYVKVRPPLSIYRRGLVKFNPETQQFEHLAEFDMQSPVFPGGHPFVHAAGDIRYVYFSEPYPLVRTRADAEHLADLSSYEAFTCLKEGRRLEGGRLDRAKVNPADLDRDEQGTLRYRWRKDTPPVEPQDQARLLKAGLLKPAEALLHLQDVDTGKTVVAHGGSVYWNDYRRRWLMIVVESFGTSALGEVWYAEADTPLGPWVYARKIITHEKYSFYNPKQHPMFDQEGGRLIYLEGTYTHTFSGNDEATPRYDYNQVMYQLDLADARLNLPVPVYDISADGPGAPVNPGVSDRPANRFASLAAVPADHSGRKVAFQALDRFRPGTVPVYAVGSGEEASLSLTAPPADGASIEPVFHALPADVAKPSATTLPLYEFRHISGRRHYSTDPSLKAPEFQRSREPLCRVWRHALGFDLPPE